MLNRLLMQLLSWFQVSDYRNSWNNNRWKPNDKYSKHHYLIYMQKRFQNGANDITGFCQKDQNFV